MRAESLDLVKKKTHVCIFLIDDKEYRETGLVDFGSGDKQDFLCIAEFQSYTQQISSVSYFCRKALPVLIKESIAKMISWTIVLITLLAFVLISLRKKWPRSPPG